MTGSYDKTVQLWDLKAHSSYRPLQILNDARDSITWSVAWHNRFRSSCNESFSVAVSEHEIITGSLDGYLRTYDIRAGSLSCDKIHHPIVSVSLSQQKNCMIVNCFDSSCRLIDRSNGEEVNTFTGHRVSCARVGCQFDTADCHVVSGSESGEILAWGISKDGGSPILRIPGDRAHKGGTLSCHYGPLTMGHGGEVSTPMLITTGADATIKVWSASS